MATPTVSARSDLEDDVLLDDGDLLEQDDGPPTMAYVSPGGGVPVAPAPVMPAPSVGVASAPTTVAVIPAPPTIQQPATIPVVQAPAVPAVTAPTITTAQAPQIATVVAPAPTPAVALAQPQVSAEGAPAAPLEQQALPPLMPAKPEQVLPTPEEIRDIQATPTVREALDIEDAATRATALEGLTARGAPGARMARDANRLAAIRSGAADRRADAQQLYGEEVKRRQAERTERRARAEQAKVDATAALGNARDDLKNLRAAGERPLSSRQIAGIAMTALGKWLGSGKKAVDVAAIAGPQIQLNARAYAEKVRSAQEQVGMLGEGVKDAEGLRAEGDRWYQLAVADAYTDLSTEFESIASAATSDTERAQASNAARSALAQAEAARGAAEQSEIDRQIGRQEKAAGIAHKMAQASKTRMEMEKTARKMAGRGKPRGPDLVTDRELRKLPKADQTFIRTHGLRSKQKYIKNPDGSFVHANTPTEARDLRAGLAEAETLNGTLTKLYAARMKYGDKAWRQIDAKGKQALESLGALAIAQANKSMELGALDNGTVEILERALGKSDAFWDNLTKIRMFQGQVESGVTSQLSHKANFRGAYSLPMVKPVPKRRLGDVWTMLEQRPDIKTGRHQPAAKRLEAGREAIELVAAELGGDLEKAAEIVSERGGRIVKQSEAMIEELQKGLADMRTKSPEFQAAEQEVADATRAWTGVTRDSMATGASINAAEERLELARANLKKARPKGYDKISEALREEEKFQREFGRLVRDREKMLEESGALEMQEQAKAKARGEQSTKRYKAGRVIPGVRPGR